MFFHTDPCTTSLSHGQLEMSGNMQLAGCGCFREPEQLRTKTHTALETRPRRGPPFSPLEHSQGDAGSPQASEPAHHNTGPDETCAQRSGRPKPSRTQAHRASAPSQSAWRQLRERSYPVTIYHKVDNIQCVSVCRSVCLRVGVWVCVCACPSACV